MGSSPEPYKPQRLRRVVRVVRPCLAFLPAAAGTSPPAPLEGRVPLVPLGSQPGACIVSHFMSGPFVWLSVWAAHPQPWALITLCLAACPPYCGLNAESPAGQAAGSCW